MRDEASSRSRECEGPKPATEGDQQRHNKRAKGGRRSEKEKEKGEREREGNKEE